ncbi:hypothetical protein CEC48_28160 [Pseudomonas sp. K2I15]|nr:hypothetical protein CEC48_28160 [Pseudomonas sp. K2I15]
MEFFQHGKTDFQRFHQLAVRQMKVGIGQPGARGYTVLKRAMVRHYLIGLGRPQRWPVAGRSNRRGARLMTGLPASVTGLA